MNKYLLIPVFLLSALFANAQYGQGPLLGDAKIGGVTIPAEFSFKWTPRAVQQYEWDLQNLAKTLKVNKLIADAKALQKSGDDMIKTRLGAENINHDWAWVSQNAYICDGIPAIRHGDKAITIMRTIKHKDIKFDCRKDYYETGTPEWYATSTECRLDVENNKTGALYQAYKTLTDEQKTLFKVQSGMDFLLQKIKSSDIKREIFNKTAEKVIGPKLFENRYKALKVKYKLDPSTKYCKTGYDENQRAVCEYMRWIVEFGSYDWVLSFPKKMLQDDLADVLYVINSNDFKKAYFDNLLKEYEELMGWQRSEYPGLFPN